MHSRMILRQARLLVTILVLLVTGGTAAVLATVPASAAARPPLYAYRARPVRPLARVHTARTVIQLRPDSGDHGYWALDDFTRIITLTRHEAVAPSFCGPAATQCFYYTYVIRDRGSFQVTAGASSPAAGTPEDLTERGVFAGGTATGWLFASWKRAYVSAVPTFENDNGAVPAGVHTTSNWVLQFWGRSVQTGSGPYAGSLGNWAWSYVVRPGADGQCPAGHWSWLDSSVGQQGDILAPDTADCASQLT